MEKWEKVLNEFLKEYVDDDSILGAILGGSYATGNYTENSDIDISIITTNDNYKKRGNVIIDDIMINTKDVKGIIVNPNQGIMLLGLLGIEIKD